ncbi:uncharacterized protein LOC123685464 [Harmonia axyridis]|uniref:uncharacterized protein LOC123685464 n=1 Tax=Harmonia axyridis TaxID=115357 RepID=UPI001E2783B3|nr:uncharacterized protein LOC123685464 [Harmonia axyridis]
MLPLKKGLSQNIVNYWTLIQNFDVSNITSEFNKLVSSYRKMNTSFHSSKNGKSYSHEISNHKYILEYKIDETHKKLSQLISTPIRRGKRGLINGLGAIWKSITGNLDQSDADKYDKAIQNLRDSQQKLIDEANSQISLTEKSITAFNNSMSKLQHNQALLESKINQINFWMNTSAMDSWDDFNFVILNSVFTHITLAVDIINEILNDIEIAISFAQTKTLHSSIISHEEFMKELFKIQSKIKDNKLPFPIKDENIIQYYSCTRIKGFISKNQVRFILEIPLTENINYNYYELFPIPILKNNLYQIIIPKAKFLFLCETKYALFNGPCQEVSPANFLCEENTRPISSTNPCEVELLSITRNYTRCSPKRTNLRGTSVHQLAVDYWMVTTTEEKIARVKCGDSVIYKTACDISANFKRKITAQTRPSRAKMTRIRPSS